MGEQLYRKRFPKEFSSETGQSVNEYYTTYKKREVIEGGVSVPRQMWIGLAQRIITFDNSWVVPHSPKLLGNFACHMNVALCVSCVSGIKYLFKYVCKGSDRVAMEILSENERYDDISNFEDARCVSASEAVWRVLRFDIVDHKPPVLRLDVHLENHHTVML